MASGFFLGGLAQGFQQSSEQSNIAKYRQDEMKLRQQAQQNQQEREMFARVDKARTEMMSVIGETIEQYKIAHPDVSPAQLSQIISQQKQALMKLDQSSGRDPSLTDAQITGLIARPSKAVTEGALARAKRDPQETALKESQIQEHNARAKALNNAADANAPLNLTTNGDVTGVEYGPVTTSGGGNPAQTQTSTKDQPTTTGAAPASPISNAKADPNGQKVLTTFAQKVGMTPDQLDVLGRAYAGGNTSVLSNMGRGKDVGPKVNAVRAWATYTLMHDDNLTPQQAADVMNFNVAAFGGKKAAMRVLGTREAQFGLAQNEFKTVAPLVLEASANVPRTQFKSLNEVALRWKEGTGDKNVVQLMAAINSAVNVYTRAVAPLGHGTVNDKEHAREILNQYWSDGQIQAGIEFLNKEVDAAKKGIDLTKQDIKGGAMKGSAKESTPAEPKKEKNKIPDPPKGFVVQQ